MTRILRNRLLVAVFVIVAFASAPRLNDGVVWAITATVFPLMVLALWVARPFHRARGQLKNQQYEDAAASLAEFETSIAQVPWKRVLAGTAVGLWTFSARAAARNTLGAVRLEQNRLDDAETHFKAALQHDAGYAVPWGNLAVVAASRGDAAAAEDARSKAASMGFNPKVLSAVIKDKLGGAK
jgi:tetratricopeptide (TPR) repeat protein